MSSVSRRPARPVVSIADLALRSNEPGLDRFREMFGIQRTPAVRLTMNDRGWSETFEAMRAPRELVEDQYFVAVRDLHVGNEAIFNPLRGRRSTQPIGLNPADLIDQERDAKGCRWCDPLGWSVQQSGLWADEFGEFLSVDGRVCARPNWARQAPISGMAFGDERMHNLLTLSQQDFAALFDAAECYIAKARESRPDARCFIIFLNGGHKSAGTVAHAHLQIVGRADRQFAYAETVVARGPADYWDRMRTVHEELGLAVSHDRCVAWANLAPIKERDISAASPTIHEGAIFMYGILQKLIRQGSSSFSLAAIPSPGYVSGDGSDERFSKWPPVLWRLVDRGDMRVAHSDIGCMELFGSSVLAADPFLVAQFMKGTC